jgi:hypothetical protein
VLTGVALGTVSLDVAPCSLVQVRQPLGRIRCLHRSACCLLVQVFYSENGGGTFIRKVDGLLSVHTVSHQSLFMNAVLICQYATENKKVKLSP